MTYTLSEFRENTREAFNKVEAGEEVIIIRHNVKFVLQLGVSNTEGRDNENS